MIAGKDANGFLTDAIYEIEGAGRSSERPPWADGATALDRHMLLYSANGGEIIVNGASSKLKRGTVHFCPPGAIVELRLTSKEDCELIWVAFELYRLSERSEERRVYQREDNFPVPGPVRAEGGRIVRLLRLLAEDRGTVSESDKLARHPILHDLLTTLLRHESPALGKDMEERLKTTIRFMQNHFKEEIRVERLAEMAQLHPSYYTQMFKQATGKTPVIFLTDLRMSKAKEMLLTSDKSIREIARNVGYGDEFYFSRRFKETSGTAPTVYKKKNNLRVVSLSYPYTDHLHVLGIQPCAAQTHQHISLVAQTLSLPKHGTEPWEITRQTFIDVRPDLIVCKDNVSAKARENINDIAPIVTIPWASKDVYTHLRNVAALVNREQAAKQWLDAHERKINLARDRVRRSVGGSTITICALRESGLRIYGARNFGHVFYRLLDLSPPDAVRRQLDQHSSGTGYNWTAIEPDELKQYDADILLLAPETESDRKRVIRLLSTNSAWMRHTAVRSGRVFILDWDKWVVYAPSVIERQLEEAARLLTGGATFA